jgi:hypothetical protein
MKAFTMGVIFSFTRASLGGQEGRRRRRRRRRR